VLKEDRPTTNPVDGNSVDKIGVPELLPSTDITGKKAQGVLLNVGETQPTHFDPYAEGRAHWEKCYGDLWKIKIAFEEKNNR
jgi:hypothetical protein